MSDFKSFAAILEGKVLLTFFAGMISVVVALVSALVFGNYKPDPLWLWAAPIVTSIITSNIGGSDKEFLALKASVLVSGFLLAAFFFSIPVGLIVENLVTGTTNVENPTFVTIAMWFMFGPFIMLISMIGAVVICGTHFLFRDR